MTHLDYAMNLLELSEKLVKITENESEETKKIVNEFYYLSKKSVEQCLARPDLFDIDYDKLED